MFFFRLFCASCLRKEEGIRGGEEAKKSLHPPTHTLPVAQAWGQTLVMEDRCAWLISPMAMKHIDLPLRVGGSDLVPSSASLTSSVITMIHQPLSFLTGKQEFISALLGCTECCAEGCATKIMVWELPITMSNMGKGHEFFSLLLSRLFDIYGKSTGRIHRSEYGFFC